MSAIRGCATVRGNLDPVGVVVDGPKGLSGGVVLAQPGGLSDVRTCRRGSALDAS